MQIRNGRRIIRRKKIPRVKIRTATKEEEVVADAEAVVVVDADADVDKVVETMNVVDSTKEHIFGKNVQPTSTARQES